jgi:hypothetical protein
MGNLQDLLDKSLEKKLRIDICRRAVQRALSRHSLEEDKELLEKLSEHVYRAGFENGPEGLNIEDGRELTISLINDDFRPEDFEEAERALCRALESRGLIEMSQEIAEVLLRGEPERTKEVLSDRGEVFENFRQSIQEKWGNGLDLLEIIIDVCQSTGSDFSVDHEEFLNQPIEESTMEAKLAIVLRGLHVKACRTASESLCLLRSGYADGANSRWRTLHEVAIVAFFMIEHRDSDLPERYLRHARIQHLRAARSYQEHCDSLGYSPLENEELEQLGAQADREIARYGADFKRDYGWASDIIAGPNFAKIERSLDLSKWRPYYKMACKSIHAGADGLFWTLGFDESSPQTLIAGASNLGLADPGQLTALSLIQTTRALWIPFMNLDGLVTCALLDRLHERCTDSLMDSHERMRAAMAQELATRQ